MLDPINPRRLALGAVKRLFLPEGTKEHFAAMGRSILTPSTEISPMSRSRDRILGNLDDMYRDAFESAKTTNDEAQMRSLDFAYRREQLYFEILLDIRDGMMGRK